MAFIKVLQLRLQIDHIKQAHFSVFLFFFAVFRFDPLLLTQFVSHPKRWCECYGNDMLFGIHKD